MPKAKPKPVVDAVVIGRNEGARLVACLASLAGQVRHVVYVDSGSTDGSQQAAREAGAEVIELDMTQPFTAARARNAGLKALRSAPPDFVQFIDGDCILREGWMPRAMAFLAENLRAAVVCGRRREQYPENSVYNTLIDAEWNTPVGESRACGGDALMRYQAVTAVRGFRDDLIAGEEPELCLRLRAQGWTVWRIEAEMTWHDAGITRFSQWWKRTERAGYAFTEGATRFHTPKPLIGKPRQTASGSGAWRSRWWRCWGRYGIRRRCWCCWSIRCRWSACTAVWAGPVPFSTRWANFPKQSARCGFTFAGSAAPGPR